MQEYETDLPTEGIKGTGRECLRVDGGWKIILILMVALHNDDALELHNFNCFMIAIQKSFEDPIADCKARTRMKTISQGWQPEDLAIWHAG